MNTELAIVCVLILWAGAQIGIWILALRATRAIEDFTGPVFVSGDERCESCTFCRVQNPANVRRCFRFPPVPHAHANYTVHERPVVKGSDWCGEWERRW